MIRFCDDLVNLRKLLVSEGIGAGVLVFRHIEELPFSMCIDPWRVKEEQFKLPEGSFVCVDNDIDDELNASKFLQSRRNDVKYHVFNSQEYKSLMDKCYRMYDSFENQKLKEYAMNSWQLWSASPFLLNIWDDIYTLLPANATIADLGCGSGRDMAFIETHNNLHYKHNFKYILVDHIKECFTNYLSLVGHSEGQSNDQVECLPLRMNKDGKVRNIDENDKQRVSTLTEYIPENSLDVVIIIRFLPRAFHEDIRKLLKPNGHLLYCTFSEDGNKNTWAYKTDSEEELKKKRFLKPKGPDHVLCDGELEEAFGSSKGFTVKHSSILYIPDGRPLKCFWSAKTE